MTSILLAIIYIAFISLGLPDSILGSAWPSMYQELQVSVSSMGIISMIIAGGTIMSSICGDRVIHKWGTGLVTAVSVAMTAIALLGFSISHSFWQLCLWGIPYGLGAGSVDVALNNFVALHYKSRHMSWLHCFWGIGATMGPYIMGLCLTYGFRWHAGYRVIGIFQCILVVCLAVSLPLWKGKDEDSQAENEKGKALSFRETVALPGAKWAMTAFFGYCALEATTGLWASSYIVLAKNINAQTAAKWTSLFYLGITIGRLICGFITEWLGNQKMIRLGEMLIIIGIGIMLLPMGPTWTLIGLVVIGLGCAPIYPCLIHETPRKFGEEYSQAMIGMQMATAYVGTTFMPPIFGILAQHISIQLYPWVLMFFIGLMFISMERGKLNQKRKTAC